LAVIDHHKVPVQKPEQLGGGRKKILFAIRKCEFLAKSVDCRKNVGRLQRWRSIRVEDIEYWR